MGTLENIDTDPIGTGPYVFKKYVKRFCRSFEANSQYFQGKPKINKMVFAITTDPNVRTQKLLAWECHLLNEPAPQDIENSTDQRVRGCSGCRVKCGLLGYEYTKAAI